MYIILPDSQPDRVTTISKSEPNCERNVLAISTFCAGTVALRVRELYPGCPSGREFEIAEHACRKYCGTVGRSAAAKSLEANPVRFAVIAHIRHMDTKYDELLIRGYDRWDARREVEAGVQDILEKWLG
jgi:hypothetical protein